MSLLTSFTRISPNTTVLRTRLLPNLGEVFVRVGQDVNPVQVIAQALPSGGYYVIRATTMLGVSQNELQKHLLVEVGATLRQDSPIMRKKGKLGRSKIYNSPVNGVLTEIRDGCLIMQRAQEPHDLRAMMHGRVVTVIAGRGAVLEAHGAFVQGVWDSGKDGFGRLKTVVKSAKEPLNADRISGDVRGIVLIVGWISSSDDLYRLENSGVRGVIAGSMSTKLCLIASSFSFPILLTDGIGEQAMSEPIFQILQRAQGKNASLLKEGEGIRGQKTAIIIPSASTLKKSSQSSSMLEVGRLARVLRWNGGHIIARVSKIYSRPRRTVVGLRTVGADVEFGSGEKAFIPYSNLDLIS